MNVDHFDGFVGGVSVAHVLDGAYIWGASIAAGIGVVVNVFGLV